MDNIYSNKYFDLYLGFCQDRKKWVWPIRTPRECYLSILLSHIILQYRESIVIVKQSNLRIGSPLRSKMFFTKCPSLYAGEKITLSISIKLAVNISTTPIKMHEKDLWKTWESILFLGKKNSKTNWVKISIENPQRLGLNLG